MDGKIDEETQQRINDGDWLCVDSQCGNINFARRNSCNRCGKDRGECSKKKKLGQEIGKVAAEKSRGLFSADDWQCSKCGNVNWARRQQCNMCNAPKFGAVEERTGYGGGYNDRGIVEYKERKREEDDDDYDEFGRRKKKRKLNRSDDESKDSTKYSPPRNKSKNSSHDKLASAEDLNVHILLKNNYHDKRNEKNKEERKKHEKRDEEEEDDDDDDEEGDLSKYDLSEWDDFRPEVKSSNDSSSNQRTRNGDKWRDSGTSRQ